MSKPVRLRSNNKAKKHVVRRFRIRPTMPTRRPRPERILELRMADNKQEAKEKIMQFIQRRPGSRTSQIIEGLGIDPIQAVQILDELKQENRAMSREIGQ